MTETPGKKFADFPDYPASRPGPLTFAAVVALIGLYVAVAHGEQIKTLFGF
jgi:hypothetical protein